MSSLKELARLLRESDEEVPKKEKGEDSVDAQIDKYLSQYESQANEDGQKKFESISYERLAHDWRALTEADNEKKDEEVHEKAKLEDISMGSFVSDVMRLVENYESLLEIKNTILRRAANYLADNYQGDVLQIFKNELLESYGIEIGKSASEKDDDIQPPKAGAAGPISGGAA